MFNPKTPNNQLPLLPGSFDYHDKKLYKKALDAQKSLAKLNGLLHLLPNIDLLITPLITSESVSSSAIENINTTTIEVLKAQALPHEMRKSAEKEVLHYREAVLYGYQLLMSNNVLITNDIITLQSMIEPNKPGIRKLPGTVIANSEGEVLYTPPEGEDHIRSLLANMEQFMNISDDIYPLIKTGVIHYQFESIHPFYDGNGRTGRILIILYLLMSKQLDYPILFISGYINTYRKEYYNALNKVHSDNNYEPIITYILDAILVQSNITSNKILAIQKLIQYLEETLPTIIKTNTSRFIKTVIEQPFISIQKLADSLGITRQTTATYVKKLEAAGIVQITHIGKHTLVSIPAFLTILSD